MQKRKRMNLVSQARLGVYSIIIIKNPCNFCYRDFFCSAFAKAKDIIHNDQRTLVLDHLKKFSNNPEIAFDSKTIKENQLLWEEEPLKEVLCFEEVYTIRKDIAPDLKIDKVLDEGIKRILLKRKQEFNGNVKEAFSNLDKNPIWLNKEKRISIKRVTITGVSNAEPLHYKKDHLGNPILNKNKEKIPVDYVSLGNNHHVAIYRDLKGKLQEKVVSLFEAVERVNQKLPIIDKEYNIHLGWEFLFTMKQNEMFVLSSDEFDVTTIDLLDEKNTTLISSHLFRVQKIATKNYVFRHHLETELIDLKETRGITWESIRSTEPLNNLVKVRLDHTGKIVQVGEY